MRTRLAPLLLLLLVFGCTDKGAFVSGHLSFEPVIETEQRVVVVRAATNLPDGFKVFVIVEAAPGLGSEASWSGQSEVNKGALVFESIFTVPLPYRATFLLSASINPDFADRFAGKALPFSYDGPWKASPSANGGNQLELVIERTIGTRADHLAILQPALAELESALTTLGHEGQTLDKLMTDPAYGFARFGRLHSEKRRRLHLDAQTTSFYFPRTFEELRKTEEVIGRYYLLALAVYEKDAKERDNQKEARAQLDRQTQRLDKKLLEITQKLEPASVDKPLK